MKQRLVLLVAGVLLVFRSFGAEVAQGTQLQGLDPILLSRDLIVAYSGIAKGEQDDETREYIGSLVVPTVFRMWLSLRASGVDPMKDKEFSEWGKTLYLKALPYHRRFAGSDYLIDPLRILDGYEGGVLTERKRKRLTEQGHPGLNLDKVFEKKDAYLKAVGEFNEVLGIKPEGKGDGGNPEKK
jgi:hypothetical protein